MRKLVFTSFVLGCFGWLIFAGSAQAQAPGGQSMPQQQPSARPSSPDMHNPSAGENNPDTMTNRVDDKKFLKDAAMGGMTEVELGKLAAQKGSSEDVKQFGQKMVDDHTKANDQLKEVATKESIQVPDALDSKHQSRVEKLSKLSGADFDKAYVKDQLKDHQQDVGEFQREAQNGSDPNVKQFASATLPVLQEHLSMIKDISKKGKSASK